MNKDQIQNQINVQININNSSNASDNKKEEEEKLETTETNLNDSITDEKNVKNNDMSFNSLKVDLGFLSRTYSEIGEDFKNLNDSNKNENNTKSTNDNKLNNININNQPKTKNQTPLPL